jgi:hypothetical protein
MTAILHYQYDRRFRHKHHPVSRRTQLYCTGRRSHTNKHVEICVEVLREECLEEADADERILINIMPVNMLCG